MNEKAKKTLKKIEKLINSKYLQPFYFSNPHFEWTCDSKWMIAKKIKDISCEKDLWAIFYGCLPIGSYEESVYYLPKALEFIDEKRWDSALIDCNFNYFQC